jgi:alpha-tubulin suppressor-like RCC1 family protein
MAPRARPRVSVPPRPSTVIGACLLGVALLLAGLGEAPATARAPQAAAAAGDRMPAGLTALVAGGEHTCGLARGALYCWGRNTWGQVGNAARGASVTRPQRIGVARNWRQVSAGGASTCGVRGAQRVLECWGLNHRGQLGDGTRRYRLEPHRVPGTGWKRADVGWFHTCAVRTGGALYCWGDNAHGQLGRGDTRQTLQRVRVPGRWLSVAVEGWTTCGIRTDRSLWCWGRNLVGQVGDGTTADRRRPVRIGAPRWSQVDVSWTHACARRADGRTLCWGNNDRGQLGDGSLTRRLRPTLVAGGARARSVSVGEGSSCLVTTGDALRCWGDNRYRQVGGTGALHRTPRQRAGAYTSVTSGWLHSCALRDGGGGTCWGLDERGQVAGSTRARPAAPATRARAGALTFSIASYNVLGEHHTGAYRHDDRFAPSRIRAEWMAQVVRTHGLDVIGVQEPSAGQVRAILTASAGQLDAFPRPGRDRFSTETTLMWDRRMFEAVERRVIHTQFISKRLPRPVVRLRHRATGREFWVMNVHNAPWSYQAKRDAAVKQQLTEIRRLERTGLPVYYVGDMNEKRTIVCKVLRGTRLESPAGGRLTADGRCVTPRVMRVDWIFGSRRTQWQNFHYAKPPVVRLTTDHWVPMTVVRVP